MEGEYFDAVQDTAPAASPALPVAASPEGEIQGMEDFAAAPVDDSSTLEGADGGYYAAVAADYSVQLTAIQESVTAIHTHLTRPLMITPFEDYSVGEGLILLLLVFLVLQSLIKIVKVGFSWLLW